MISKRAYIRRILITIFFIIVCHVGIAVAAGIQINSNALEGGGAFISETVVSFVVTDPQGRKVGYDTRTGQRFDEFDAGYGAEGIDDIVHVIASFTPMDNGIYTIELIGDDLMAFSLEISILREAGTGFTDSFSKGVIDKGLTSRFQFTYTSDPAIPLTFTRVAAPGSLKQDITLSRKIGWIDNDGIMTSLLEKAEAIEASIQKDGKKITENLITAFINEVNAQAEKHISKEAVKMLIEDAEYIMNNL